MANKFLNDTGLTTLWTKVDDKFVRKDALNNTLKGYLPLSGGTLTGPLDIPGSRYASLNLYGINLNNSDIVGLNSIYFSDSAQDAHEGLNFARNNGNWDIISSYEGTPYYFPNCSTSTTSWDNAEVLIHSGNYSSYALPLSGGTITSSNYDGLIIKRASDSAGSMIVFENNNGRIGILGFEGAEKVPIVYLGADTSSYKYLIHSGNIENQSVSLTKGFVRLGSGNMTYDANTMQGGILVNSYSTNNWANAPSGLNVGSIIHLAPNNEIAYSLQIAVDGFYDNIFLRRGGRGTWSDWKQIAFLDSNMTSAQQLAHSNGTVGVKVTSAGALQDKDGYRVFGCGSVTGQTFTRYQAFGSPNNAVATVLEGGGAVSLKTQNIDRLFINSSGNVGIGTTNPQYKLDLVGSIGISSGSANTNAGDIVFSSLHGLNGFKISSIYANYASRQDLVFYSSNNTTSPYTPIWEEAMRISYTGAITMSNSLTMSGGISYKGTKSTYEMIGFLDNSSNTYGNGIRIGGGGTVIIGAGESSTGIAGSIVTDYNDEILHLAADGDIKFYSNCDTIANRKEMSFNKDGSLTINGKVASVVGHTHTKSEVGLGNVDNTADANKSVKYAVTAGSTENITCKYLNYDQLDNLDGTFCYYGAIETGSDTQGIQIGSSVTKMQLDSPLSTQLRFRTNDTGGTDSSNWGGWNDIYHTGNLNPLTTSNWSSYCAAASHTHNYLPLGGGTLTGNLIISKTASVDMSYSSGNPSIEFCEADGTQPVKLMYTDYDNYRSPAGLKVIGNQGNEWFEVDGSCYANKFIKKDGTEVSYNGHSHSAATTSAAGFVSTGTQSFAGAKTFTSTVTATGFYEESDERLKDFEDDIDIDLNAIKKIPKKYFKFKEDPTTTHIGTSAQVIKELYPELVTENEEGYLSVDYAKLSVIALSAIDKLIDKINHLENLIKSK